MYLNYTRGCNCCVSRKLVSDLPMKRHTCESPNLAPIVVPEICCLIVLLNSKKLPLNINPGILIKPSVGKDFLFCLF